MHTTTKMFAASALNNKMIKEMSAFLWFTDYFNVVTVIR